MIDDDQPHNRGDPNVDKIAQQEVKSPTESTSQSGQ